MEIVDSGIGELIQPPDLEAFREWNRTQKPRTLIDKRMTEQEAIARFVNDGDYVGTKRRVSWRISTPATMDFDPATCRMRLKALHPGVTVEQVVGNTGFELVMPDEVEQNQPPTARELQALRDEIDSARLYI